MSAEPLFPGDTPLSDDEIRQMGYEPTSDGWVRDGKAKLRARAKPTEVVHPLDNQRDITYTTTTPSTPENEPRTGREPVRGREVRGGRVGRDTHEGGRPR